MDTSISILICTRDRLPKLQNTLRTVGELSLPTAWEAELVVVDNGSTDGTAAWVENQTLSTMPVRLVEEPRPGTGYARTTAVRAARGDVLLFTDDDVRVHPDWAEKMCTPILEEEADVVAGTAELEPSLLRPWMNAFHRATLASTEETTSDQPSPITINMAFHRRVLREVPAFDPELGPGSRTGCCEDVLFSWQLQEAGFRFAEVGDATVEHHPSEDRLRRSAFLEAARERGRSTAYLRYHWLHWDEWDFTNRTAWYEIWRHPYCVVVKRWAHLMLWRVLHIGAVLEQEGIRYYEFSLVNLLYQALQYLKERKRPRNYEKRGLVKRGGVQWDENLSEAASSLELDNCRPVTSTEQAADACQN